MDEVDLDTTLETVESSLVDIWHAFLGHLPQLAAGVAILLVTAGLAWILRGTLERTLGRTRLRRSLRELIARLVHIALWVLGLLFAAMVVFPGLTPTKALSGLGLASVAIGFAFKDIFENFFAGILILWRFPFDTGDFIESGDIVGRIEEITVRNTMIRRTTGELVVVPNSRLFTEPVEVLTDEAHRRMTVVCGVSYDSDVPQAVDVIQGAVRSAESVVPGKDVQVFPKAFGSSSIDIEVAWWTGAEPLEQRKSRAEVVTAIKSELDAAGIEIPFPYRTLTFKEPLPVLQTEGSE